MYDLLNILASVTAVSLVSLVGIVFIGLKENLLKRILMVLIGFSSGTLLGATFLHLLPGASERLGPSMFYYVILGIVSFFALEKFLYWRHCHEGECPVHMFVYLNLIGDAIHNFVDGMIIAATFGSSLRKGLATTLAVISHEIPQEIGDFGVQIYGGLTRRKALVYNFLSALAAVLGALVAYFLSSLSDFGALLVPFAAGGFIYIAATDLMPELHKKSRADESIVQLISILLGIVLMAYLSMAIPV
jgi:zinc and cadmium transporter